MSGNVASERYDVGRLVRGLDVPNEITRSKTIVLLALAGRSAELALPRIIRASEADPSEIVRMAAVRALFQLDADGLDVLAELRHAIAQRGGRIHLQLSWLLENLEHARAERAQGRSP